MSYKALYRKYRPQVFEEVVGQAAIVKTLQNAILSGKTSHAYLFCGPRGTGKTTIARIFAKAINCTSPIDGEPCTKCTNCIEISDGVSPDVIEIDAASNNGVDEIRDIREKVKFLPSGSKYKIYIIDEVHMLSTGAFNALLKTLEEPPKHVIFILATTEVQKLPATIISRCQRYDFKPLGTYEISMQLHKVCDNEEAQISDDAINAISEAAEGGMRDALSILDQVISYGNKDISIDDVNTITGTISFDKMSLLMNYIESKNINMALETVNDFLGSGKEAVKIISAMLIFCRDILLYKSVGNKNTNKYIFEKEKFQELAFKLNSNKVLYYIDVLCDILNKIKLSTTPSIYIEIAVIKLCSVNDVDLDLMKRVGELETKVDNVSSSGAVLAEGDSGSNEKLSVLDAKVNQVVTEFNKLELHKMSQRIDDLSQMLANQINISNSESGQSVTKELDNLKLEFESFKNASLVSDDERIEELEKTVESLKQSAQSNNTTVPNEVQFAINNLKREINELKLDKAEKEADGTESERLVLLEEKVKGIITNSQNHSVEADNSSLQFELKTVKSDIEEIKDYLTQTPSVGSLGSSNEVVSDEVQLEVKSLKRKINDLYDYVNGIAAAKNKQASTSSNDDLQEIKEKLETLESRMYKLVSSSAPTSKTKLKAEKTVNGQIMLFGEEVQNIDDIENKEEKTDFGALAKEDIVQETIVNDTKEDVVIENVVEKPQEQISLFEELQPEEAQEEISQEQTPEPVIEEMITDNVEVVSDETDMFDESEENNISKNIIDEEEQAVEDNESSNETLFDFDVKVVEKKFEENYPSFGGLFDIENEVKEENVPTLEETSTKDQSVEESLFNNDEEQTLEETSNVFENESQVEETQEAIVAEQTETFKIKEETVGTQEEIIENQPEEFNVSEDNNVVDQINEEQTLEENVHNDQVVEENNNIETPAIEEQPKVEDRVVSQFYNDENKEQVTHKINSSLVVKDKDEKNADVNKVSQSILKQESIVTQPYEPKENKSEIIIGKAPEKKDKFALYDVNDLSQIMFDAYSLQNKNDKVRILEIWKTLTRGVPIDLLPIASLLSEGSISAVGNKEFVLTYPDVSLCNQVMRSKFKRDALKILYGKLGDYYNYIALPSRTWAEKREEAIKQYNIGVKKPRLTPFNIPGLNVISDDEEYVNTEEKTIQNAIDFFGDDIVNIK